MGNGVDSVLIRSAICTDFNSRNVEIARYVNRRVVVVIIAFIVFQMLSRSVRSFGREKNIARGKFKGFDFNFWERNCERNIHLFIWKFISIV